MTGIVDNYRTIDNNKKIHTFTDGIPYNVFYITFAIIDTKLVNNVTALLHVHN